MTTIRDLKKDAKIRLSENYFKILFIYLIYSLIIFAFTALTKFIHSNILKLVYLAGLLILLVPFSFGLISCIMDIVRGKKVSISEFINVGFKNIPSSCKVFLRIFLKLLIPIFFLSASISFLFLTLVETLSGGQLANYFIIALLLVLISFLVLFIVSLYYSFAFYLLKDKPDKSSKEIINMSRSLMKGNVIKNIGLSLSFIGWYLMIFAISYFSSYFLPAKVFSLIPQLGTILLFPYITTTMIGFYEDVLYNKTEATQKAE